MAYLIDARDVPNSLALRQQNRPEHLAYLAEHAEKLILAGAQWDDDGQPIGSVVIVDVDTREEAEAFAAADPFSRNGVFGDVTITEYRVAFLDRTNRLPA